MQLNSEYSIKNFCFKTTPLDVFELMKNKHKKNQKVLKKEFYRQKYSQLYYYENPLLSKLIYHKNIAVAHVGAFPMKARVGENSYQVLQIGDIVTHSDYRGKGLFSMLINAIINDSKKQGYSFLFVVPNSNVLPIFLNKLNWNKTQENFLFIIKIKTFYLNKIFNKLNLVEYYEKLFSLTNRKFKIDRNKETNIYDSNIKSNGIIKDSKFHEYKSYSKNYFYKFKNGIVWFKLDDGILIGDIQINKIENIEKLINELELFAKNRGIHKIKINQAKRDVFFNYFENKNYTKHESLPLLTHCLDDNIDLSNWSTCIADYNTF